MKLNYLLFCDSASVSEEGKVNLFGIFDRVSSSDYPAVHMAMTIAFELLFVEEESLNVEISITHRQSKQAILTYKELKKADLSKGDRYRLLLRVNALPLRADGLYDCNLKINGKVMGSTTLIAAKA